MMKRLRYEQVREYHEKENPKQDGQFWNRSVYGLTKIKSACISFLFVKLSSRRVGKKTTPLALTQVVVM